ncbi:MAG: DUF4160 domain-containing protein [Desulfobulbaceae bacterium]|nr:DUF4160 domain-containing protein [Desulfobulbaceae bacterium]
MPTILQIGRYQFKFFSNEGTEPPHIHVKAGREQAKFWVDPIALAANYGFKAHELSKIENIIEEYQDDFIEAWYEYFS